MGLQKLDVRVLRWTHTGVSLMWIRRLINRNMVIALFAFAAGYATLNAKLLIATILYRLAAQDFINPILNGGALAVQAGILLAAIVMLPRLLFWTLLIAVALSGLVNVTYGEILRTYPDPGAMSWMLSEVRQLNSAMREFWPSFLVAGFEVAVSLGLFSLARRLLRPAVTNMLRQSTNSYRVGTAVLVGAVALPDPLLARMQLPQGAELNAYPMILHAMMMRYPSRAEVSADVVSTAPVDKIVWLVDESISHSHFARSVLPNIARLSAIDFGEAASMGNCSAISNATLRWGVNVETIGRNTDLRRTPTIWGYAKHAGFRTMLVDGQVLGAPQNMVWEPELSLVDEFHAAKSDIFTDRKIAERVNAIFKKPGRDFIYVVLRGAHYAYESNYPTNTIPSDSPLEAKYLTAVEFSKQGFFDALFEGVDRGRVAVFYTSDHGQIIAPGVIPHCNVTPDPREFSVPLLAFLPRVEQIDLSGAERVARGNRSHSQIFPTTLVLMGYARTYAEQNYDALLDKPTRRFVWFGKSIIPRSMDASIEVFSGDRFPAR